MGVVQGRPRVLAKKAEEQRQRHEVVAWQVAEVKMIQHQVWMPEASGSRRNGDLDVSSPSPSPTYIRLIWRQAARVCDLELETFTSTDFHGIGKCLGHPEGALWGLCLPWGALHPRGWKGIL